MKNRRKSGKHQSNKKQLEPMRKDGSIVPGMGYITRIREPPEPPLEFKRQRKKSGNKVIVPLFALGKNQCGKGGTVCEEVHVLMKCRPRQEVVWEEINKREH